MMNSSNQGYSQLATGIPGLGQPLRRPPRSDVVLVFPYKTSALVRFAGNAEDEQEEEARHLTPPSELDKHKMQLWATKRQAIFDSLSQTGLVLYPYFSRDRDEIFVKIAADENHIRQVAEMIKHKLELKTEYLSAFAPYKNDYAGQRDIGYSDRRVVSHLYQVHTDDTDDFEQKAYPRPHMIFRAVDRIQIIDYIIRSGDRNCAGIDIGALMHDGDIVAYFPLQENRKLKKLDEDWFMCFAWGKRIDRVRDYFGERVAMYFLFMSHFNQMMTVPAVVGVALWIVGLIYGTPDNITALPLCIGMGFWSTFFIHFWRRTCAKHAIKWGTLSIDLTLEPSRPEFRGVSKVNPITERIDRYYPWTERIWKVMFSYAVVTMSLLALAFVVAMLMWLRHIFAQSNGRLTFQVINAILVETLNFIFTDLAKWLTDRENHRTDSEYASHMLTKTVVFKFINCYISLYYIAFFKSRSYLFGSQMMCVDDDCMNDLGSQLAIFLIVRLTIQNFIELGVPYLYMWYRKWSEGRQFSSFGGMFTGALTVMPNLSNAEKQCKKERYDIFSDMDEILILYGYTTLFISACPWVPVLAWVGGVLECFLDQKKLVLLFRRPSPQPARDNEPWDTAFDIFGLLALFTNVSLVIFASHEFDTWYHWEKILLFIAIEHGIIFARIFTSWFYAGTPKEVKLLELRQRAIVHKHINLGGEEDDHDMRASIMRSNLAPALYIHDYDAEEDDWL